MAAITLLGLGTAVALGHPALPDVSWPLYLAREMLHGARLTVNFQEVNPPLFVWISLPAALLGQLTGAPLWIVNVLVGAGSILGSLALSDRLLEGSAFDTIRPFLLPCLAFVFAVFPLDEFGNREHIALVLTAPYVLLAAVRMEGGRPATLLAVLAGLLGALGFALKPYFLVAWALVEGLVVLRLGRRPLWRVEAVVLVATGAGYALAILLVEPGYLKLATTWAGLYGQYLRNELWFSMFPDLWGVLPVFAAGTVVALSVRRSSTALHHVLVVAAIGFWVGAVIQRKAFNYHHLAGAGYGFLVVALAAREAGRFGWRSASGAVVQVGRVAAVLGVLLNTTTMLKNAVARGRPFLPDPSYPRLLSVVRREAAGQPILVLSSNPAIAWPLTLEAGAIWSSRFMCQWQLAALYHEELWWRGGLARFRPFHERQGVERLFADAMLEDLVHQRPRLIVVLNTDPSVWGFGGATRLDYLGYFGGDPRFSAELQAYEELEPLGRYRLFRRR